MLASTGGFSALTADRGVGVGITDDESALLGIDMPDNVVLEDGSFEYQQRFWGFCTDGVYEYEDQHLATISDQSRDEEIQLDQESVSLQNGNEDYPLLLDETITLTESGNGVDIHVDINCDADVEFGSWTAEQVGSSTGFAIEIETNDGPLTVELERDISVICLDEDEEFDGGDNDEETTEGTFRVDDVDTEADGSSLQIELTNTAETSKTIDAITVTEAGSATEIQNGNQPEALLNDGDAGEIDTRGQGNLWEIGESEPVDDSMPIESGEAVALEIIGFQNDDGDTSLSGEHVILELEFGDEQQELIFEVP